MQPAQLNDCCHLCVRCPVAQQNPCFVFFLSTMWPTSLSGGNEPDGDQRACGMQHMLRTTFSDHVYGGGVGRNSPLKKKKKKKGKRRVTVSIRHGAWINLSCLLAAEKFPLTSSISRAPSPPVCEKVGGRTWNEMVQPFPYLLFKWSDLSLLV